MDADAHTGARWMRGLTALFAAGVAGVWIPWSLGLFVLPSAFGANGWMAHELLYGVVPLVAAARFWRCGRVKPLGLVAVTAAWAAGRFAVGVDVLGPAATVTLAMALPLLVVLGALPRPLHWPWIAAGLALIATQGLFHWEVWRYGLPEWGVWAALVVTVPSLLAVTRNRIGITLTVTGLGFALYGMAGGNAGTLRAAELTLLMGVPAATVLALIRPRFERLHSAAVSASVVFLAIAALNSSLVLPLLPAAGLTWVSAFISMALSTMAATSGGRMLSTARE